MTPVELINSFVAEKLEGDIQRLADFPLGSLRNDKVYGCPNRNFDPDDTELMRAFYCVVFGDNVDDNYKPVVTSKGYTYWRGGYTNRDRFISECHRYIDFSTEIIKDRARRMIERIMA